MSRLKSVKLLKWNRGIVHLLHHILRQKHHFEIGLSQVNRVVKTLNLSCGYSALDPHCDTRT